MLLLIGGQKQFGRIIVLHFSYSRVSVEQFLLYGCGTSAEPFNRYVGTDYLSRLWIYKTGPDGSIRRIWRRYPTNDIVPNIGRIPVRIIGHDLHHNCVFEPGLFKSLIPFQSGFHDGLPELNRRSVFNPPHNWFNRLTQRSSWIFLYKIPAIDHVFVICYFNGSQVVDLLHKISHSRIVAARAIITVGHFEKRMLEFYSIVASVRNVLASTVVRSGVIISQFHYNICVVRKRSDLVIL